VLLPNGNELYDLDAKFVQSHAKAVRKVFIAKDLLKEVICCLLLLLRWWHWRMLTYAWQTTLLLRTVERFRPRRERLSLCAKPLPLAELVDASLRDFRLAVWRFCIVE